MANGNGDQFDNETKDAMQELIREMGELNAWYNEGISKKCELEDTEYDTCLDCLHDSDTLMNSWIMDLTEQNGFLLNLIKETEEEGNKVIGKLDRKLSRTKTEESKMKLEKQKSKIHVDNLLYEKSSLEKQYKKIQEVKKIYDIKKNKENENFRASEKQLHHLSELSVRLESKGVWDIQDLQLDAEVHDQLFRANPEIIGGPCPAIVEICRKRVEEAIEKETLRMDIRLLNESIKNKNKEIDELKEKVELNSKQSQDEHCGDDWNNVKVSKKQKSPGTEKESQTTMNLTELYANLNSKILPSIEPGFTDEFLKL